MTPAVTTQQLNEQVQFDKRRHADMKLPVQHVGNYVIYKKTLGAGSMGTVKLAECLSAKDHQLVSCKKFSSAFLISV